MTDFNSLDFCQTIDHLMATHKDTSYGLHKALVKPGEKFDRKTISTWRMGTRIPRTLESFEMLRRVEAYYGLETDYLKRKLPCQSQSPRGHEIKGISKSEMRRLAWHLPDDFAKRSAMEQAEIVEWVRTVIISGTTDYRKYQALAMKTRYSIRFPGIENEVTSVPLSISTDHQAESDSAQSMQSPGVKNAPHQLAAEMKNLLSFKTQTLTAFGYQRLGVWGEETASQKVEHLGLMFGAMAASPSGEIKGLGVPLSHLGFGMLVFPAVWDWYVQWRERKRGFYTAWEVDMLRTSLALTRPETGWLRQTPDLAKRLHPVPGLIFQDDIDKVRTDWAAACDLYHKHASSRIKEIERVARIHRDPFEPILVILEATSPVAEYRKITEEILFNLPNEKRHPRAAAECVRAFLMLRFGLHLGLRQKNMRQLLVCSKGETPSTEKQLVDKKCGELRWNARENGWEVFIPAIAFKNSTSSYFSNKPYRLILPDLGELYKYIDDYLLRHRTALLGKADDPGTFFVKTVKVTSKSASYDQTGFYDAWRLTIQRYGIYNPYTKRGAIKGLLPHGPHNIRDVLATHILKVTGSYEQASYAIQDTPAMVAQHYGRFLPQHKAELAARVLNVAWADEAA